ncbi:hypothetical protein HDU92_001634 [Lobulomyces angularis]|nr:hypothetical protein HDU92_001634 [Lobulomyces angularis]
MDRNILFSLRGCTFENIFCSFHADEALAVFMLKQVDDFKDAKIIRTRDPKIIEKADIVVDVGAEYLPEKNRFDHHQRSFNSTFSDNHKVTKLSSAGLIYKHFGREVLKSVLSKINPQDQELIETIYQKLYTDFIEGMDAVDNGVSQYPAGVEKFYKESTSISKRISRLNPWWNEANVDVDERFYQAVEVVGLEFLDIAKSIAYSWIPARDIVGKAIARRKDIHTSGKIIILDQFCPWKEHLYNFEKELNLNIEEKILFVLYEDQSKSWRVQAVSESSDSFVSRKTLPERWMGLRDENLSKESEIADCIFVHASGFIGGNKTKNGALEMAIKAITI